MVSHAGVIAVQGDVKEHASALRRAFGEDVTVSPIRSPAAVSECDFLIIPGGESTTISRLIEEADLADAIWQYTRSGNPLLATCAGLILLAVDVPDDRISTLDLLDVRVDRNAFGRQRESFEAPLTVTGLDRPFPGVFIRAPRISDPGTLEILATYNGEPVAVRQGSIVGASFHPELTGDPRFHYLVNSLAEQ